MPERQWLEAFFSYLKHEKRYSKHTSSAYQRDLVAFDKYIASQNVNEWSLVTVHHVRQYTAYLHKNDQAPKSIQRKLSSLRRFFHYLMRENHVDINPVEGVRAPKADKTLPRVLDVDQVQALFTQNSTDPLLLRDMAMLELLYGCGLRLSELVSLDVDDFDYSDYSFRVTGKGDKTRILPFGKMALLALNKWIPILKSWAVENERALFISKKGVRISPRTVQSRLQFWGKKQGLTTGLHPHRLRHSFASHLLESSGDIRSVQELLGHADLSSTQIYTQLDYQHLALVYDKAHPRAKK